MSKATKYQYSAVEIAGNSLQRNDGLDSIEQQSTAIRLNHYRQPRCHRPEPLDRKLCVPTFRWVCLCQYPQTTHCLWTGKDWASKL